MAIHYVNPDEKSLHGHFSPDLAPILTIQPGDTVIYRTLDAGWNEYDLADPFSRPAKIPHDRERDSGHALCGPIAIVGAQPGMTLAIHLKAIRSGTHGFSVGGGFQSYWNERLGLVDEPEWFVRWRLDPDAGIAVNQHGQQFPLRPFMGVLGLPPAEPGRHPTAPPRFCGGNLDCKELVTGSTLYLPITVEGGLFSIGDGHGVQGDGEVSGVAIECPMQHVEVVFELRDDMPLQMPRAETPAGWISFGVDPDLNEAAWLAISGMLDLLESRGYNRKEALMLSSLAVDLRVTQMVNRSKGVHALLPHNALDGSPPVG